MIVNQGSRQEGLAWDWVCWDREIWLGQCWQHLVTMCVASPPLERTSGEWDTGLFAVRVSVCFYLSHWLSSAVHLNKRTPNEIFKSSVFRWKRDTPHSCELFHCVSTSIISLCTGRFNISCLEVSILSSVWLKESLCLSDKTFNLPFTCHNML